MHACMLSSRLHFPVCTMKAMPGTGSKPFCSVQRLLTITKSATCMQKLLSAKPATKRDVGNALQPPIEPRSTAVTANKGSGVRAPTALCAPKRTHAAHLSSTAPGGAGAEKPTAAGPSKPNNGSSKPSKCSADDLVTQQFEAAYAAATQTAAAPGLQSPPCMGRP